MIDRAAIAIYISAGSMFVSLSGFAFTVYRNTRVEMVRAYDKVYEDACDLLMYPYHQAEKIEYENEDKELEKAVRTYSKLHWTEQTWSFNMPFPNFITSEEEKKLFLNKVAGEFDRFCKEKSDRSFKEAVLYQSPVFHLADTAFSEKFSRLLERIGNNLSLFSPQIRDRWEKMKEKRPELIKDEYIALNRVNEQVGHIFDESVDDPFKDILLLIRQEYRQLTKPWSEMLSNKWFSIKMLKYRFIPKKWMLRGRSR